MRKWEQYTKDEIAKFVEESKNYTELCKKLGYKGCSALITVKQMIKDLQLDVSHFSSSWNKGVYDYSRFTYGKEMSGSSLSAPLIALRGHRCEKCNLDQWLGFPIKLEVHHKDGDRHNNVLENLELLCPNCHSMTDNWCKTKQKNNKVLQDDLIDAIQDKTSIRQILISSGLSDKGSNYKRIHKIEEETNIKFPLIQHIDNYCKDCGKKISTKCIRCDNCNRQLQKNEGIKNKPISRDELKRQIRTMTFVQIGENFHVSDNTIRKWCKLYGLPYKSKDIKRISDEDWINV